MQSHSDIERKLVEFLVNDKGVPRSNLLFDPTYTNSKNIPDIRPDIVVADELVSEPLAIFEVKKDLTEENKGKYTVQVQSYADIDKDRSIPVYLVTGSTNESLRFYEFTEENELIEIPASKVSAYKEFPRSRSTLRFNKVTASIDNFKVMCFGLALVVLAAVCLDIYLTRVKKFELLTTNRMALILASAALMIIPFAQKIKVLGMEYERMRDETKNSPEKSK